MPTGDPHDPFHTLGLEASFELDRPTIESAYLKRAARFHPDTVGDDPDAREEAARNTARLNHARETLSDAERRAEALLVRLGGAARGDDKSMPQGFLMQMMELREQIESELADPDDAGARTRWEDWATQRRAEAVDRIRTLFASSHPEKLNQIRLELNQLRYIVRLIDQLDPDYDPAKADFGQGNV